MIRIFAAIVAAFAITLAGPASAASDQTVVLDVQNMTCELCPLTVRKSLERVPGVADAKINLGQRTATVKFDPDKVNVATLIKATTNAGYPATAHK